MDNSDISESFNLTSLAFEYETRGRTFLEEVDLEKTSKHLINNPGDDQVFIRTREKFSSEEPSHMTCTLSEWLGRVSAGVATHLQNHMVLGTYDASKADSPKQPRPEWIIFKRQ